MPKVRPDPVLLNQVNKVVHHCGGEGPALQHLDIDKTTLWRFRKNGCAIERTRNKLKEAVLRYESAIKEKGNDLSETNFDGMATISVEELKKMKVMFQSMLLIINSYETSQLSKTNVAKTGETILTRSEQGTVSVEGF